MGESFSQCQGKGDEFKTGKTANRGRYIVDLDDERPRAMVSCKPLVHTWASHCGKQGGSLRRRGDHIHIRGEEDECVEIRGRFCGGKQEIAYPAGGTSRLHRSVFDEDLFCDGHDRVTLVHHVRQELDTPFKSIEPAIVIKDSYFPTPEQFSVVDESYLGMAVEFMARASRSNSEATYLDVYFNDMELLSRGLRLTGDFRLFRYEVPLHKSLWNIAFLWYGNSRELASARVGETLPDEASDLATAASSKHVVELDQAFGVRVQGRDLMHSMRLELGDGEDDEDRRKRDWKRRGQLNVPMHESVRKGILNFPLPVCRAVAESALEFVAHGETGREYIDVYVNGMTVPCELNVQLGKASRRLYRYALAPASVVIKSVVFVVQLRERKAGEHNGKHPAAVIDPSFGVMVGGQDCLMSAVFVDATTGTRNPDGWAFDSPEASKLRSGQWSWDGVYYLLAYRRTMRPRQREPPRKTLATSVVPEETLSPAIRL